MLGLGALTAQVAVGVDDAAWLAGGAGGEDDQRRVLGAHRLDCRRSLLWPVLVQGRGDLVQGHRRRLVGQLAEHLVGGDAERRLGGVRALLEVAAAQLRAAGQGDGAHPPAGEQRQRPLDPVAEQRHHDVTALHSPRRKGPGEPGRAGDQFAEVPVAPVSLGIDSDDPQARSRRPLHYIFNEVHGRQSAVRQRFTSPSRRGGTSCTFCGDARGQPGLSSEKVKWNPYRDGLSGLRNA